MCRMVDHWITIFFCKHLFTRLIQIVREVDLDVQKTFDLYLKHMPQLLGTMNISLFESSQLDSNAHCRSNYNC